VFVARYRLADHRSGPVDQVSLVYSVPMQDSTRLRQSWQINKRETEDMRRVNLEIDGLPIDALVVSSYSCSLILNLPLDVLKVCEPPSHQVVELGPFLLPCYACRRMRYVHFITLWSVLALTWHIDELKNEGSPCYNAAASW